MSNFSEAVHGLHNEIAGSLAVMLVDSDSGMLLTSAGNQVNADIVGAGMTTFTSAFNGVLAEMGNGLINETVFTVGGQLHAMHRVTAHPSVYVMAIVDSRKSNLATVRLGVQRTARSITL